MVRQITATFFFLVSLFFLGACGNNRNGTSTVPQTDDTDFTAQYPSAGGTSGGGDVLPGLGGDPASGTGTTPGLPNVGSPSESNLGGINAPSGANLSQVGSDFASAWQNIFNQQTAFDPRQVPDQAKSVFTNFMCAMQQANLFRVVSHQMTLPEYVSSLYINVLKRAPESRAVIDHHSVNILNNGTRAGVRGFILSDEHLNKTIRQAYRYFYGAGRAVTDSEITSWRNWLKRHVDSPNGYYTLERMYANFLGSAEFYRNRSSNQPRAQVINMYRYALGRPPVESEIQFWMSGRNYGVQSTRVNTAFQFFTSDEYRLAKIGQLIRSYWAVPVTGDELAIRLQAMKNGRDQFITMTDLLTDPRYFTRVRTIWQPFSSAAQNGQCGG
jgi:hypothetical protein